MPFLTSNPYTSAGAAAGALQMMQQIQRQQIVMGTHPEQIRQKEQAAKTWQQYGGTMGFDPDELNFQIDGIREGFIDPGELYGWEHERRQSTQRQQEIFDRQVAAQQAASGVRLSEDEIKRQRADAQRRQQINENLGFMRAMKFPGTQQSIMDSDLAPLVEVAIQGGAKPHEAMKTALQARTQQQQMQQRDQQFDQRMSMDQQRLDLDRQREERYASQGAGGGATGPTADADAKLGRATLDSIFNVDPEALQLLINPPQPAGTVDKEGKRVPPSAGDMRSWASDKDKAAAKLAAIERMLPQMPDEMLKQLQSIAPKVGGRFEQLVIGEANRRAEQAPAQAGTTIQVRNEAGETYEIDQADLAAAEADGFRRVQP